MMVRVTWRYLKAVNFQCPHQAVSMQPPPLRQGIPSQQHTWQSHLLVHNHIEHSRTHRNDRRHCRYQWNNRAYFKYQRGWKDNRKIFRKWLSRFSSARSCKNPVKLFATVKMYKMWAAGSSFYGDPHTQVKSLGLIKHTTKRTQPIPFMFKSYKVIKYKTNDKWTKVCGCIYLFKIFPDKKHNSTLNILYIMTWNMTFFGFGCHQRGAVIVNRVSLGMLTGLGTQAHT